MVERRVKINSIGTVTRPNEGGIVPIYWRQQEGATNNRRQGERRTGKVDRRKETITRRSGNERRQSQRGIVKWYAEIPNGAKEALLKQIQQDEKQGRSFTRRGSQNRIIVMDKKDFQSLKNKRRFHKIEYKGKLYVPEGIGSGKGRTVPRVQVGKMYLTERRKRDKGGKRYGPLQYAERRKSPGRRATDKN